MHVVQVLVNVSGRGIGALAMGKMADSFSLVNPLFMQQLTMAAFGVSSTALPIVGMVGDEFKVNEPGGHLVNSSV